MQILGNRSVMYETEGREGTVAQKPRAVVTSCFVSECIQCFALVPLLCIHTGVVVGDRGMKHTPGAICFPNCLCAQEMWAPPCPLLSSTLEMLSLARGTLRTHHVSSDGAELLLKRLGNSSILILLAAAIHPVLRCSTLVPNQVSLCAIVLHQ